MGVTIRSTVKNAARFAVYDEINIKVKNHHTEPTIRPDNERGEKSQVCCMSEAIANQNEFNKLNSLSEVVWCVVIVCVWRVKLLFGGAWALMGRHSCGENLDTMYSTMLTPRKLKTTQTWKNKRDRERERVSEWVSGLNWKQELGTGFMSNERLIFYLIIKAFPFNVIRA